MKRIAVLLTCFNRKNQTISCLKAVKSSDLSDLSVSIDIFLPDDNSSDGTKEAVKLLDKNIHIVQGNGQLYWNRGMYHAWQAAVQNYDYDYYLWLNDDTIIFEHSIRNLIKASEDKNDAAIIVGATRSANNTISYGGRINDKLVIPCNKIAECNSFNGNIVLITRSVYHSLGNLDYYYSHALGDFDYGLRALKSNIRIFQTAEFEGVCEPHNELPRWCNPQVKISERIKAFQSPLGGNPKEIFHFERSHRGAMIAAFHFFTIYLRVIIPQLWNNHK